MKMRPIVGLLTNFDLFCIGLSVLAFIIACTMAALAHICTGICYATRQLFAGAKAALLLTGFAVAVAILAVSPSARDYFYRIMGGDI